MSSKKRILLSFLLGGLSFYLPLWPYYYWLTFPGTEHNLYPYVIPFFTSIIVFLFFFLKRRIKLVGLFYALGMWLFGLLDLYIFGLIHGNPLVLETGTKLLEVFGFIVTPFISGTYIGYMGALVILSAIYPLFDVFYSLYPTDKIKKEDII